MATGSWGTPYGLRQWYGHTYSNGDPIQVTNRLAQALERLRINAGENEAITVIQGCHHHGEKSGTTHDKDDVADISAYNMERRVKEGADLGLIVFHRPYGWDGAEGGEHCHVILRPSKAEVQKSLEGTGHLDSVAAAQVLDWDAHTDGLYHEDGKRAYTTGPWFPVKPFVWHPNWEPDDPAQKAALPPLPWPRVHLAQIATGEAERGLQYALSMVNRLIEEHPDMQTFQDMRTNLVAAKEKVERVRQAQLDLNQ